MVVCLEMPRLIDSVNWADTLGILRDRRKELVEPGTTRDKMKKGSRAWRKREREKKMAVDRAIERAHNQKQAARKYYERNKAELNRKRQLKNSLPGYVYMKSKWRAEHNGFDWDFTEDTWLAMWMACPRIRDADTGFYVTAWSLRGSNAGTSAQMVRLNLAKGWSPENCEIQYRGEAIPLEEGRWES